MIWGYAAVALALLPFFAWRASATKFEYSVDGVILVLVAAAAWPLALLFCVTSTMIDAFARRRKLKLNADQLEDYVVRTLQVELDCERRALTMIQDFGLDVGVSPGEYAQQANAYVLFYHAMALRRRWYQIGREPYNLPEVWMHFEPNLHAYNYVSGVGVDPRAFDPCFQEVA